MWWAMRCLTTRRMATAETWPAELLGAASRTMAKIPAKSMRKKKTMEPARIMPRMTLRGEMPRAVGLPAGKGEGGWGGAGITGKGKGAMMGEKRIIIATDEATATRAAMESCAGGKIFAEKIVASGPGGR